MDYKRHKTVKVRDRLYKIEWHLNMALTFGDKEIV